MRFNNHSLEKMMEQLQIAFKLMIITNKNAIVVVTTILAVIIIKPSCNNTKLT